MDATASPSLWFYRIWLVAALAWLAFIAWRAIVGWPVLPLDMGGADPATVAAYQAAQLQHAAQALGLAVAVPAITFIMFRIACRARRS